MDISTRTVNDIIIVDLSGKITLGEGTAMLRNQVRTLLSDGHTKILLNLGDVSYVDSSGIGELVSAFTSASNKGGTLKLLNLTKKLQELLSITKLLTVFEAHEDEGSALASFQ